MHAHRGKHDDCGTTVVVVNSSRDTTLSACVARVKTYKIHPRNDRGHPAGGGEGGNPFPVEPRFRYRGFVSGGFT